MTTLKVVLVKPSKYAVDGYVERFKLGFMPNATLYHIAGLTPEYIGSTKVVTHTIDEYVRENLEYLELLKPDPDPDCITIVALVGVQTHQFHRALDLAAYAHSNGIRHCIIGGPHPMTCDTTQLHNLGISFALAEAEVIWNEILDDALTGDLKPVYGLNNRWAMTIDGPVIEPPSQNELDHYIIPLLGLYPVRGCPYDCNYCSVIKISGQQVRSTAIEYTIESLTLAKKAGIKFIFFVSDNFNKYPEAVLLLEEMIARQMQIPFSCQCDAQIVRQPEFVELLGRAGCHEMFVGVESFDKKTLREAKKFHNQPNNYKQIVSFCSKAGISAHFSNIIGFPNDTKESIQEQLETIQLLRPAIASFYILTPIPGTEQYADYISQGLIIEENIDRYDATNLTWRHPNFSPHEMSELLFRCYIDFYTHSLKTRNLSEDNRTTALAFRHFAKQGMHPMSGGTGKRIVDHINDYIELRKKRFGIELVQLPKNLELSPSDKLINKGKDWKLAN